MSVVEAFNDLFCNVMGRDVDREPGVFRRLMEMLMERKPGMDRRIARKLVSTRLHIRLRWLNQARDEVAALKRGMKQLRHHVCSGN